MELRGTYRLQLGPHLDFRAARGLVPYLTDLGVTHLYLSPVMQARAGSTHGYDVVDPTRVSDDLGGEAALRELADAGLGLIVDVVPNHMAAVDENPFWRGDRERFFDIDPQTGEHRRFFDVDELAGVRVEDPEVFATTHSKLLELVADGVVEGLRIDHIDGLADPAGYLRRLHEHGVRRVWVEKILESGEALRPWPVEGTTGYEFLGDAMALFVDPAARPVLAAVAHEDRNFHQVAYEAKLEQVHTTFRREVERLQRVHDVEGIDRALAALPVYRTYVVAARDEVDDLDRMATRALPDAVARCVTLDDPCPPEFVTRFQQTSGAVMAKGVEDTADYRYLVLLALNEVGSDPGRFAMTVDEFHDANRVRHERTPRGLLAAQTHDTKRSLDVRSRLVALSWVPEEWSDVVRRWRAVNAGHRGVGGPDDDEELFLYQTLAGAWPLSPARLEGYLRKALREAKRRTSWVDPDEAHEEAVLAFARAVLADPEFRDSFEPFVDELVRLGERISLGQVVLRLTAPGVPDIYQGDELWDLSLVDPDNRRPVDWEWRRDALAGLRAGALPTRATAKLFVTERLLQLRARQADAFSRPSIPIGAGSSTCAFARGEDVVVVVPTRDAPAQLPVPPGDDWRNVLAPLEPLFDHPPAVYERAKMA